MFWFALAGGLAALDLATKWYVRKYIRKEAPLKLAGDKVRITLFKNKGAMLGFMKGQARLLLGISVLFVGFIAGALYGISKHKGHLVSKIGLSFFLGGAISNVYDRATDGCVTDYLQFNFGPKKFRQTIFNIGDFFIFIGSLLSVIGEFLK